MFNNIRVGVKLVGGIAFVVIVATALILYGAKVRHDYLSKIDSASMKLISRTSAI